MRTNIKATILGLVLGCAALMGGNEAKSDATASPGGTEAVYGHIPRDQVEFLTPGDRIKSVASSGAPMAIWEALEHGERVECLECIPAVSPLLYDANARTREIAAWWLRRRIIGVFGPGEVYQTTVNTLKSDPSPQRRAYAAYALGEFLVTPGIAACATALASDKDPTVRVAAASALGRLNDDGNGALTAALKDGDERVRAAAITSAGRISSFGDVHALTGALAALSGDASPVVRRRSIELLDTMRAKETVASMIVLAKSDPDANVRLAACHALGAFQDKSAQATLQSIADSDANGLVRDQAKIALRRL
jgi:HEAT repeat protein